MFVSEVTGSKCRFQGVFLVEAGAQVEVVTIGELVAVGLYAEVKVLVAGNVLGKGLERMALPWRCSEMGCDELEKRLLGESL